MINVYNKAGNRIGTTSDVFVKPGDHFEYTDLQGNKVTAVLVSKTTETYTVAD